MVFRDAPPFFYYKNRWRLWHVRDSIGLLLQRTPTPPREHRACWGPRLGTCSASPLSPCRFCVCSMTLS